MSFYIRDITARLLPNSVFIHDVKGECVEARRQMKCVFFPPEWVQVLPDGRSSGRDRENTHVTKRSSSCGTVRLIRVY